MNKNDILLNRHRELNVMWKYYMIRHFYSSDISCLAYVISETIVRENVMTKSVLALSSSHVAAPRKLNMITTKNDIKIYIKSITQENY